MRKLVLAVLIGVICAGPATTAWGESHLTPDIVDFGFAPDRIVIDVGQSITWTNTGGRPHTVTDRGGTFDTGSIAPGAKDAVTFSTPGRYTFFCRINPGKMNGVIEVKAGADAAKAVRIEATDPTRDTTTPLSFTPDELEVAAGTPIVLANVGGKPHSLTADDGSFDTGIVVPGAQGGKFAGSNATLVPTKGGTFPFHCEVHPAAMKGVLTVTGEVEDGAALASGAANKASVDIVDFAFEPDEVSVSPGGTVTWSNTGEAPHTATFDDVDLDTANIEPGSDAALVAPAEPGSYSYRCNVHPAKMRGTLVVVGAGIDDPTKASADEYAKAAGDASSGGGISAAVLATGVIGAFLGGFGVSSFVRRKPQTP